MTAPLTDEARARLAEALHDAECTAYVHEGRNARCEREARALAPVVADLIAVAKAEAWDEGEQAGRDNADDGYPDPMWVNPYRAVLDGEQP